MPSRHLAVCSWSVQPSSPKELIHSLKRCGLNTVQMALVPVVEESLWADAAVQLQDAGVKIVSGMLASVGEDYTSLRSIAMTGGVRLDETWPATRELANRSADVAASMGLTLVTFHAGFLPAEHGEEREKMLGRLRQLVEVFSSRNIDLAFETGQETAEVLSSVLHELDYSAGVNFDPANMILYGNGDPVSAMHLLAPWVKQIHIKDARASDEKNSWGIEVPVGQGNVDWKLFMQAIPHDVNLVIERESGETRIEDIKTAIALIKELHAEV